MLGFGAGNEYVGRYLKIAAIELLMAGDVLGRFAVQALMKIAAVVDPGDFAEFIFRMGVQMRSFAVEGVSEQNFRCQPGCTNRAFLEQLGALKQSCLKRHGTRT